MANIEFMRKFVAETVHGEKENKDEIVHATGCNSSVSITLRNQTIHIPWSEIAIWMTYLCKQTEEERDG